MVSREAETSGCEVDEECFGIACQYIIAFDSQLFIVSFEVGNYIQLLRHTDVEHDFTYKSYALLLQKRRNSFQSILVSDILLESKIRSIVLLCIVFSKYFNNSD